MNSYLSKLIRRISSKRTLFVVVILTAGLIPLVMVMQKWAFFSWIVLDSTRPVPTDAELKSNFVEHRSEFDQLKALIFKGPDDYGVSPNWIYGFSRERDGSFVPAPSSKLSPRHYSEEEALLVSGFSPDQRKLYVQLLNKIGAESISRYGNLVTVHMFGKGFLDHGTTKDIVYSPWPGLIVQCTDGLGADNALVPLSGGWFIQYRKD
jgi:hypothetical protein